MVLYNCIYMDMELDNNIQFGLKETLGQILGLDETLGQILGLDIELDNVCLHFGPYVDRNMDLRLEVHH